MDDRTPEVQVVLFRADVGPRVRALARATAVSEGTTVGSRRAGRIRRSPHSGAGLPPRGQPHCDRIAHLCGDEPERLRHVRQRPKRAVRGHRRRESGDFEHALHVRPVQPAGRRRAAVMSVPRLPRCRSADLPSPCTAPWCGSPTTPTAIPAPSPTRPASSEARPQHVPPHLSCRPSLPSTTIRPDPSNQRLSPCTAQPTIAARQRQLWRNHDPAELALEPRRARRQLTSARPVVQRPVERRSTSPAPDSSPMRRSTSWRNPAVPRSTIRTSAGTTPRSRRPSWPIRPRAAPLPTCLQVTTPSVISGQTYFVTVTTPGGTSAYSAVFTYNPGKPVVAGLAGAVNGGSVTGGNTVTIEGTGFWAAGSSTPLGLLSARLLGGGCTGSPSNTVGVASS